MLCATFQAITYLLPLFFFTHHFVAEFISHINIIIVKQLIISEEQHVTDESENYCGT